MTRRDTDFSDLSIGVKEYFKLRWDLLRKYNPSLKERVSSYPTGFFKYIFDSDTNDLSDSLHWGIGRRECTETTNEGPIYFPTMGKLYRSGGYDILSYHDFTTCPDIKVTGKLVVICERMIHQSLIKDIAEKYTDATILVNTHYGMHIHNDKPIKIYEANDSSVLYYLFDQGLTEYLGDDRDVLEQFAHKRAISTLDAYLFKSRLCIGHLFTDNT